MRTLIVQPPLTPAANPSTYAHALVDTHANTPTDHGRVQRQWTPAALLPKADRHTEVVLLVPVQALSWQRAELPAGLGKQTARLQAALQGLLEERLLGDASGLHLALQADWKNTPQPWVAACDKAWLTGHLQALEAAGLVVHRIVPEIAPVTDALQVQALGDSATGWLWFSQKDRGVWGCPVAACASAQDLSVWAGQSADDAPPQVSAEPALAAWIGERLPVPPQLSKPGQHWLQAIASDWDLAQFDLQTHARARQLKSAQKWLSALWRDSAWRPARWGVAALLLGQVLGLNAWAWKTRSDWQTQQQGLAQVLQATFPNITVVVDAPLQMNRELDRLRRGSGQLSEPDLEALLQALGRALPASFAQTTADAAVLSGLQFQPGQLRVQGLTLSAEQQQTLHNLGYSWRAEGDGGVLAPREAAP